FPHVALNGTAQMVFDGERFFLDDFSSATFDLLARNLVPVVPNLSTQIVDGIHYFCQPPWLFDPFLLYHQVRKLRWLDTTQRLAQGYEIERPRSRKAAGNVWVRELIIGVRVAEILRIMRDKGEPPARRHIPSHGVRVYFNQNRVIDTIPLPVKWGAL